MVSGFTWVLVLGFAFQKGQVIPSGFGFFGYPTASLSIGFDHFMLVNVPKSDYTFFFFQVSMDKMVFLMPAGGIA